MRGTIRIVTALAAIAAAFAIAAASASAFGGPRHHGDHGNHGHSPSGDHHHGFPPPFHPPHPPVPPPQGRPVFVQTDNPAGNQIVAYDRNHDGTLTEAGAYDTGGLGGVLEGSVVDHLASQASLVYDGDHNLLYAVNAGSNSVSVFSVYGDHLALQQVISSGGTFPVSIAVHDNLVYVLNAEQGGSVQGYGVAFNHLFPIPASGRGLGLDPTATPQFVNTPGQVAFSPDGSQLIVTTKANGSDIDVFGVDSSGRLSAAPVVNPVPGAVPFAVSFDQQGNLIATEAGPNVVGSFTLHDDGTITPIASVATGQAATCWVALAGGAIFASNAGSGTLTTVASGPGGQLSLVGQTATDSGTVDATVSADSRFLYVQAGAAGIVDEFAIGAHGALTEIGSATVPGAVGGEGIVAL
jgi:6-phosphogluconolactonase (cycloisomerase 2 family)